MRLPPPEISKQNMETIERYLLDCKTRELHQATIKTNKAFLYKFGKFLGKTPYEDVTKEILIQFFDSLNYNIKSKNSMKCFIKKFYKWLLNVDDDEPFPKIVRWIKVKTMLQLNEEQEIDYYKKKMISDDEYQKQLQYFSDDMQMQAIIELINTCGCRISEALSPNICDVDIKSDYIIISVRDSKTKKREIPIKPIPEYVLRWFDIRRNQTQNHDEPLFINQNRDNRVYMKRLHQSVVQRYFRYFRRDTGIKKKITPHNYRHTAVTKDLANGMPLTHASTKFGWTKNSVMFRFYDHNDSNELVKYVTGKSPEQTPSIDILQQQKVRLEKEINEKQQIKAEVETLKNDMKAIKSVFGKSMLKPTSTYNGEKIVEFPGYDIDEVIQNYNQLKENVGVIISRAVSNGVPEEEIKKYKSFMDKLMA